MKIITIQSILKRAANLTELLAAATLAVGLLQNDFSAAVIGVFCIILTFLITWYCYEKKGEK